ncbi:MAG: hypothetical protein HOK38_02975 [Flavobacteriaceae bacterium]|nr:hypothetical protein [Flavobacteriaceae bacterium]
MKKAFIILPFTLLLIQNSFSFVAPKFDWKIASQTDGVIIYKAKKDDKSGIIPIKFQTDLNYSPSRVLAVLADSSRKTEWIPKLKSARTVKLIAETQRIEYTIYDSPWPFDNRSFLIQIDSSVDLIKREIISELHSITMPEVPLNNDLVRGTTYYGKVLVRGQEPGKTYLEMTLLADFKGNIPTWIVNIVQGSWPKNMVKNIKRQLKKADLSVPATWKEMDVASEKSMQKI